jgi:hypothetical protein
METRDANDGEVAFAAILKLEFREPPGNRDRIALDSRQLGEGLHVIGTFV